MLANHPLVQRLNAQRITESEGLVGETITALVEEDGIHIAFASGKWARILANDQEEYSDVVYVCSDATNFVDVDYLRILGLVPDDEYAAWEKDLMTARDDLAGIEREHRIRSLRSLIAEFPDIAAAILQPPMSPA